MKLPVILIHLFLLFTVVACGGKKSSTKTSLVLGGLIDSIAGQSGGTMIYGRQLSGGSDSFAIKLPYSQDLELPNGMWRFAAVTWDGNDANEIMSGQTRCGLNEVNLLGGDQTVAMTLSKANCFAQFFGDDKSKEVTGEPKKFLPATCALLDEKRGRIDNGQCKNSVGTSFTVELPQKLPGANYSQGLVSACNTETTASDEFLYAASTNLRIPMFFPIGFNEPMIKLTIYEDAGCTQNPQVTTINNPLAGVGTRSLELDNEVSGYTTFNVLYVHNPVCEGSFALGAAPFDIDGGGLGPDYILCNPTQFSWIQSNDLTGNYFLDSDLDYLGVGPITAPIISSPFTGSFDGRGHTVYDLDMDDSAFSGFGMFADISGRVSNLNIEGADLDVTSDRGSVGVLAGTLSGGGVIENIDLFDINITLNGTSAGAQVGALVGYVNNTAPNAGVRNITAEAITLDAVGYKDFGAIIGLIDGTNSRVNDITVDYVELTFDNSTGACVGGVFGTSKNGASVENISVTDLYIGDAVTSSGGASRNNIGGIAGCVANGSQLKSARIIDSEIYTASSAVGGAVGFADPIPTTAASVTIKDVLSSVDIIEGDTKVGGIVGEAQGSAGNVLNLERSRYIGPVGSGYVVCVDKCAGLVGSLGGAGAIHTVTESWVRDLDIESTGSGTTIGGLIAVGQDAVINSVFGDNISLTTTVAAHTVGGLYGDSTGTFSVTDAYFKGDVYGDTSGNDALITSDATAANLIRIYTVGTASKGSYATGTPTTASATNIFTTVASSPNATTASQGTIQDSSTLNTAGFSASVWTNITSSGVKELIIEEPYVLFANSGLGTRSDPYLISTEDAWNAIDDKPNFMGKAFKLVSDLDFTSMTFNPIGSFTNPFWGNLSGNNFSISNILDTSCTIGAFGVIGQMSTVIAAANFARDVGVNTDPNDGYLYLYDNTFNCTTAAVGSLVGKVEDRVAGGASDVDNQSFAIKIHNIVVDGADVSATTGFVGVLIGYSDQNNNGTVLRNVIVSNSVVDASAASSGIGGLFGMFTSTSATAPTNHGRVETLKSINNTVTSVNASTPTGGIFGEFSAEHLEVRKMISNSTVSGSTNVGGIVGNHYDGRIAEAVSKGDVSGSTNVGGFVGSMSLAATVIDGSYSTASVTAGTIGSGFAGSIVLGATIKNSWYDPSSLAGAATLSPADNITGVGSNLVMVGSDTVRTGLTQTTLTQLQNDPVFFAANFTSIDPFVFGAGDYPRPYFEVWPQFFND